MTFLEDYDAALMAVDPARTPHNKGMAELRRIARIWREKAAYLENRIEAEEIERKHADRILSRPIPPMKHTGINDPGKPHDEPVPEL